MLYGVWQKDVARKKSFKKFVNPCKKEEKSEKQEKQ